MKLTEELNIKDYTLRKICEDFNIPRPKSGYWTKLRFDKNPPITRLPANEHKVINLEQYSMEEKSTFKYRLEQLTRSIEEDCAKELVVPQKLRNKHPLIKKLKSHLSKNRSSFNHGHKGVIFSHSGYISISVAKENQSRLVRIIETFIRVAEKRKHNIIIEDRISKIKVDDMTFEIYFREKTNRRQIKDRPYDYSTLVPNGKLSIKLKIFWDYKEWIDGYEPLENQLAKIIAFIELRAEDEIKERIEWDKQQAENERLAAIKRAKQARIQWEEDKKEILVKDAQVWHEQTKLAAFIEHIKIMNPQSEKEKNWLNWAQSVLDDRDILKDGISQYVSRYEFKDVQGKI